MIKSKPTRRDVLRVATGAAGAAAVVGAVGAAAYMVPLLDEMNSDAAVPAVAGTVDVDLSPLQAGQQIMVFWRSWPIFVVHRTPEAVAMLRDPDLLAVGRSRIGSAQQPPYAKNRQRSVKADFAVLVGICTHGCTRNSIRSPMRASRPPTGWAATCPCHGSKYDLAGRVFKDFPAPYNLPVPPHRFIGDKIVRIGENPPNVKFDFNKILQI